VLKKIIKWFVTELPARIFDRPLLPPSSNELDLIAELRREMASFSLEAQNRSDVTDPWKNNIKRFEKAVQERDPREFLRWDECLPLRAGPTVFPQFFSLLKSGRWASRWRPVMDEGPVGYSMPFFLYPKVGGNIILHAHHVDVFEQYSGKKISDFAAIVEFGGGYGGMCRLIHKLGFKGRYLIFDLPQQTLLQRFYLKASKLFPKMVSAPQNGDAGIFLIDQFADLKSEFKKIKDANLGLILFIANWSLSESPIPLREEITTNVIDQCDYFLINYQEGFHDIDNRTYFKNWTKLRSGVFSVEESQMPLRKPADFYLLGKRKIGQ